MIRVLVVDDEKLARKGIIGLIDWDKYGMEVAGEADNGDAALQFLARHPIDLLITDLSMPGLSGIAFLRAAKKAQPSMEIVVLTMHQDFDLIQQALRLGVVDYITKAQIERENIDSILRGILRRYQDTLTDQELSQATCTAPEVSVLLPQNETARTRAEALLGKASIKFYRILDMLLLWLQSPAEAAKEGLAALPDTLALTLTNTQGCSYADIGELLREELPGRLFLDFRPKKKIYRYDLFLLCTEKEREGSPPVRADVIEKCKTTSFMTDDAYYEQVLSELMRLRLPAEEQAVCLYPVNLHWAELAGRDLTRYFDEVGGFRWWYQWREWFDATRAAVRERLGDGLENPGNEAAIRKATAYIRENLRRDIPLDELLRLTGMSKSHFSRLFKQFTGTTFVNYVNDLRVEEAKRYLAETEQPVYWVAEAAGFANERYFRRVFEDRTGEKPKQYRNKHKNTG